MGTQGKVRIGCAWMLLAAWFLSTAGFSRDAGADGGLIQIAHLPSDIRGGQAYRLVYDVPLPIEVVWKFKTSFDNKFLEKNRHISYHRLVSRKDNVAITEDRYSDMPDALFRWKTRIFPEEKRLEFRLVNSSASGHHGHRFHYGHIQLTDLGGTTRVTQVAYFDFWGAGFWANYPWSGGMQDFLEYTAQWERKEAVRFYRRMVEAQQRQEDASSRPFPDRESR